ncbi:MAG: hypothetical protein ABSE07_07720 [Methanoregula sp.]|jgi:hypothetical protein
MADVSPLNKEILFLLLLKYTISQTILFDWTVKGKILKSFTEKNLYTIRNEKYQCPNVLKITTERNLISTLHSGLI